MARTWKMLLRFPGGKSWLAPTLIEVAEELGERTIIEPFVGGGGTAIPLLRSGLRVAGADLDPALVALWNAVRDEPDALIAAIRAEPVTLDRFYERRLGLLAEEYVGVDAAAAKMLVHQMSFGTLGEMAGGPIGGRTQLNREGEEVTYKFDCRWSPDRIEQRIRQLNPLFQGLSGRIQSEGFRASLRRKRQGLLYLDPPYLTQGAALYRKRTDHLALRDLLATEKRTWVLSYEASPDVKLLYARSGFYSLGISTATRVAAPKRERDGRKRIGAKPRINELLITNNGELLDLLAQSLKERL